MLFFLSGTPRIKSCHGNWLPSEVLMHLSVPHVRRDVGMVTHKKRSRPSTSLPTQYSQIFLRDVAWTAKHCISVSLMHPLPPSSVFNPYVYIYIYIWKGDTVRTDKCHKNLWKWSLRFASLQVDIKYIPKSWFLFWNWSIFYSLLTPWCRVLLEKLIGLQLVKKFPAFHGTRKFITALTSVRHLYLSCASPIQSIYPHPTSWRSILILSTHLRLGLPSDLFPSGFPTRSIF